MKINMTNIEKELREEFHNTYYKTGELTYCEDDGSSRANVEAITRWWLFRFNTLLQQEQTRIAEEVEKMIKYHKEKSCVISDSPEFDPTNMTRNIENPLVRQCAFNHIDFVRELEQLSIIKQKK